MSSTSPSSPAGKQVHVALGGDSESFGLTVGDGPDLATTYCNLMVRSEIPNIIADSASDARVRDLPTTADSRQPHRCVHRRTTRAAGRRHLRQLLLPEPRVDGGDLTVLGDLGVEAAQGYLLGRPSTDHQSLFEAHATR